MQECLYYILVDSDELLYTRGRAAYFRGASVYVFLAIYVDYSIQNVAGSGVVEFLTLPAS